NETASTLPETYLGDNAVSLIIQKQSGTNTVEVVDRVKKRLGEILPLLPADIQAEVIRDQSRFIKNSIDEVKTHLLLAAVLVSLTVLLVIFIPIPFTEATLRRFFNSLGIVVVLSVLMSLFLSSTMTPMLCSRFLKAEEGHASSKARFVWRTVPGSYRLILGWSLRHR